MYKQNQEITDKYLNQILSLFPYQEEHRKNPNGKIQMACPLCSCTRSTESKKRTRCSAFLPNDNTGYFFNCFHCKSSMDFNSFLMAYAPALQKKYHRDMELNGLTGKNCNLKKFRPKFESPRKKFNQRKSVGIGTTFGQEESSGSIEEFL